MASRRYCRQIDQEVFTASWTIQVQRQDEPGAADSCVW